MVGALVAALLLGVFIFPAPAGQRCVGFYPQPPADYPVSSTITPALSPLPYRATKLAAAESRRRAGHSHHRLSHWISRRRPLRNARGYPWVSGVDGHLGPLPCSLFS